MHTQSWDGMETNLHRGVGITTGKKKKTKEELETGKGEEEKKIAVTPLFGADYKAVGRL